MLKYEYMPTECTPNTEKDVGFLLDVSGSVGRHWQDEQSFVKRLAKEIFISPAGGHAAVTIFSSKNNYHPDAQLMIKFSDHTTLKGFEDAVDALPYWSGGTRINKGLEEARDEMFRESNGMRPTAHTTLVLITDGNQAGVDHKDMAKFFHDENIRVIVIGVGNVNTADLLDLVKVERDFHLAENFEALLRDPFIRNITICEGMVIYII